MADTSIKKPNVVTRTRLTRRVSGSLASKQGGKRLNWPYAFLSLVIGALLWFGVDMKRMEEMSLDVDVEFTGQLPADWKFVTPPLRTARIVVRGARQEISALKKEELLIEPAFPPGALDGDVYDGMLTLQMTQVRGLPVGVTVQSITPQVTPIRLAKTVTRYIQVEAGNIVGTPQEGYEVRRVQQIDPAVMPISASREFLSKIGPTDVLRTKDFSVEGGHGLVGGMVGLEPFEKDGQTVTVPGLVYMAVELAEVSVDREFEEPFEVRALIDSPFDRYSNLTLSPPSVKVTLSGPKSVIDKVSPGEITIYADMRDRIPAAPGEFNIKCRAITPSRVRVTRIEPDTVKWLIQENTSAPPKPAPPGGPENKKP